MRIFGKICLSLLLLGSWSAHSWGQTQPTNAIKINPISIFLLTGNLQYERAINERWSAQMGIYYAALSLKWDGEGLDYSGIGFTPEVRYYFLPQQQALNGLYVAPFVRYQRFRVMIDDNPNGQPNSENGVLINNLKAGANIGYQLAAGHFILDAFAGPTIGTTRYVGKALDQRIPGFGTGGLGIRMGICLGVGF